MVLGSGIRDPRSGIRDPEKTYSGSRIPDPGVKKHPIPDPGSRIRIRNTAFYKKFVEIYNFFPCKTAYYVKRQNFYIFF